MKLIVMFLQKMYNVFMTSQNQHGCRDFKNDADENEFMEINFEPIRLLIS